MAKLLFKKKKEKKRKEKRIEYYIHCSKVITNPIQIS